ncbi:MAG: iron-siderophore ABC transporter substrate-binding protein [Bauldia sp.]|nr:iron-siderophore ABC transporter substrate-binding protein [Bauldia sp.]
MSLKTLSLAAAFAAAMSAPALAQDAFPVTIAHAYGETVIAAKPERVVIIGWIAGDVMLALGEMPLALPIESWGGGPDGMLPWIRDRIAELGGDPPVIVDMDLAIPFEELLALEPDLILAPYSGLTDLEYARLAAIAPTVAFADTAWSGAWQDVTRTVGRALGREADAETLIADTETYLVTLGQQHPEFAGKTFAYAWDDTANGNLPVYVPADSRVQATQDLGLVLAPGIIALPAGDSFWINVSLENLATIDADILITWHSSQEQLDAFRANPLVARYRPVAEGHHVGVVDRSRVMAQSAPGPLAMRWEMDQFVAELADLLRQ